MEVIKLSDILNQLPPNAAPMILQRLPRDDWPFLRLVSRFWRETVDGGITSVTPRRFNLTIATKFRGLQHLDMEHCLDQLRAEDMLPILIQLPDLSSIVNWPMPMWSACFNRRGTYTGLPVHHFGQLTQLGLAGCRYHSDIPDLGLLFTRLQALKLHECKFSAEEALKNLQHLGQLTRLELTESIIMDYWDDLKDVPTKHLKVFRLPGSQYTRAGFHHLLAAFSNLTELDISNDCQATHDEDLTALNVLSKLTFLGISSPSISSQGARQLTALTRLQDLEAKGCLWTSPFASRSALQNFPNLRDLDLSGCMQLRSNGGLTQLRHLTSLKVTDCRSFGNFLELHCMTQLLELSAGGSTITDKMLQSIKGFPNLRYLDLSHDKPSVVTDAGIAHLSALVTLKSLSLSGMQALTNESMRLLRALTRLTKLDISMCVRLTTAGVRELKDLPLDWLRCQVCEDVNEEDLPTKLQLAFWKGHRSCAWSDS